VVWQATLTSAQYHHSSLCHFSGQNHIQTLTPIQHILYGCCSANFDLHACVFEHILERCFHIWSLNLEIFQLNQYAAPAACVQAFLNGSIGVRLPSPKLWANAYYKDPETAAIIKFDQNLGTISNKGFEDAKLNANFCTTLRQSHLMMEDGLLIYCIPIAGSKSYAYLIVVPTQL
jgi:hypothetical protein